ncbi:MAG: (Fe-S)-binding protein [Fretibacterium sp.]|nr:(Fe-S)-binding protein [Fretibacterium sp.]
MSASKKTFRHRRWGLRLHQSLVFSPLFCRAVGAGGTGRAQRVFFPGCSLAAYAPHHVLAVSDYLRERLEGVGVLLKCCGKPLRLASLKESFQARFDSLRSELDRMGAEEVIVACQNCYVLFNQLDERRRVRSLWTLFEEQGLPEGLCGSAEGLEASIQDSCTTRGIAEITGSVRSLLDELGVTVHEMEFSRERARCCGYGPQIVSGDAKRGRQAMLKRAAESPCETIVSYCASCRSAMGLDGRKSLHLLDLIFGAPPPSSGGPMRDWLNRWRARQLLGRSA